MQWNILQTFLLLCSLNSLLSRIIKIVKVTAPFWREVRLKYLNVRHLRILSVTVLV